MHVHFCAGIAAAQRYTSAELQTVIIIVQWNMVLSAVAPWQFLNNPANCYHTTPTMEPKHYQTLISKVSSFQEDSTLSVHELKSHKMVFLPLLIEVAYQ